VTENKALQRDVRRRMTKTGERYTAARRNVTKPPPRVADPGMSDASVQRGSGRTWDEWFAILDTWGASRRKHPEIARFLSERHGVPGWWAQTVTVGYERARGMRAPNERPDGFTTSVSKTLPVPAEAWFIDKGPAKSTVSLQIERLPDAGAVEEARAQWKARLARLAEELGG
jgi:hypothetical protein